MLGIIRRSGRKEDGSSIYKRKFRIKEKGMGQVQAINSNSKQSEFREKRRKNK